MRLIPITIAAFLVLSAPVFAAVPACGVTWQQFRSTNLPSTVKIVTLTPAQTRAFTANYNAEPPVSTYAPDHIYVVILPGSPAVFVAMVKDNCIIQGGPLDPQELAQMITRGAI